VSTSFQFINGAVSSSKTYTYSLLPSKTGTFKISPASVTYQENTYRSNPIELVVTKQRSASNQPNHNSQRQKQSGKQASSDVLFLRAVPSQRSVYVNEQITLKYKLYFRVTVRNPEFIKLPETTGFWVEEYPIPKDVPVIQEVLNGVQYNVAELKKFALFPTKAGKLSISSMRLAVDVIERRRRDPFNLDNFFDSPFGRS
ncbi:MAG: hypothetical protein GWN16_04835, partial [Calditrichae bacterium]|nr:hypothetical protein [Calditrichia bacterium]